MARKRKIIQMALATFPDGSAYRWVLCDDGSIWYRDGSETWRKLNVNTIETTP